MSDQTKPESVDQKSASKWPKRWLFLLLCLLPFGLVFQVFIYFNVAGSSELRKAIEEADRLDPGWRLEELEAKRETVPDAENSALVLLPVHGIEQPGSSLIPSGWGRDRWPEMRQILDAPNVQLSKEQTRFLQEELSKVASAVEQARKVADMPRGRYPIKYANDGLSTLLSHVSGNRTTVSLLALYDAFLLLEEGKTADAWRSWHAALNTSNALGDEPCMITMLVRMSGQVVVVQSMERLLAQGELPEAELAVLQQKLEQEAAFPFLLIAMRGRRAMWGQTAQAYQTGELPFSMLVRLINRDYSEPTLSKLDQFTYRAREYWRLSPMLRHFAYILRLDNELVEIAKRPIDDQWPALQQVDAREPVSLLTLTLPLGNFRNAMRVHQSYLRAAIAAIASERHRRAHGHWLDSPASLTPQFLAKWPLDPHSVQPMLFKRLPDGLVIYSVGRNSIDDNGRLDRVNTWSKKEFDVGFQLWDTDKRRQPATTKEQKP